MIASFVGSLASHVSGTTARHPIRWLVPTGLLVMGGLGCADAEQIAPPTAGAQVQHQVSFDGYAYDAVTGARLTGYSIDAIVGETTVNGTIGTEGRYLVGPVDAWSDFSILIGNSGYRPFLSHNAAIGLPPELAQSDDIADLSTHQTLFFDAYLFPSDLEAPAVTLTIATAIMGEAPDGRIRLRPIGPSLLSDSSTDAPGGVDGQVWINDEDLQGGVISADFSGGTYAINAGELVYGVEYQVDIYDVAGYQPLTGSYSAGIETNKTFTLTEEVGEPVTVVSSTASTCQPPASANATSGATITVEFNQPVEFATTGYPGGPEEALDDGLSIISPDANNDTVQNTLKTDMSDTAQERGVSANISGTTLTINFDPSTGLDIKDAADPIETVTYSGLGNVSIQRLSAPSSAVTLATLLGVGSVTCD